MLALAGGPSLLGCDRGHQDTQPLDAPPVKVIDVQVATTYTADGLPDTYKPIDAGGTLTDAAPTTSVRVRFDRFLGASNVFRQSICVQSNLKAVKSLNDCTAGPVFFEPSYDPVHRELVYRQSPDPAKAHMETGVTYRVTLFPPDASGANGIAAFDGAPLAAPVSFTFTTQGTLPANAQVEKLPTDDFFCPTALPALTGCAFGGCHATAFGEAMPRAAEGLDLSTQAFIRATAINHVAHQTEEGESADVPDESPQRFGRAMPIIDPGFPGNSYLIYKLLAGAPNVKNLPDPPSEAEIARLRASVVVGMPMPPSNFSGAVISDPAKLEAISAWILEGAPTPSCP